MANTSAGTKQMNIVIPEDLYAQIDEACKSTDTTKAALVTKFLAAGLEKDDYAAALEAAGSSRGDLESAKMHLDKIFQVVETLVRQKEEAHDIARHEVQKDFDRQDKVIERLNDQIDKLSEDLQAARTLLKTAQDQTAQQQKELDAATQHAEEAQQKTSLLEKALADKDVLLTQYKTSSEKNDKEAQRAAVLDREIAQLKDSASHNESEIGDLKAALAKKTAEIAEKDAALALFQTQIQDQDKQIKAWELKYDKMKIQADIVPELKAQHKEEIQMLKKEIQDLKTAAAQSSADFSASLERMRSQEQDRWTQLLDRYMQPAKANE